jgi:uncharacterized protein with GYD domain
MPTFVTLQSFTDKGIKDIKNLPQRDAEIMERLKEMGITVTAYYMVMGQYDEVVVWDAPSDEVAAAWLLELGTRGNRRSVTLRAFGGDEFQHILAEVP